MKIKDLPEGKIRLNDGSINRYKIDKKQKHIARNTGKYIVVNKDFLDSSEKHKKTIYYHERGHNFWFNEVLLGFSLVLAIVLLISLIILFYSILKKEYGLIFSSLIAAVTSFISYVLTRYLIETICDFNAVKNMGIKNFNEAIINYYKKHNKNDFIEHPHWKLREKITGDLN